MVFNPNKDYWLEVPAGRYTVGLLPDEARELARQSAEAIKRKGIDLSPNEGKNLRRAAEMLGTTGNPEWVEQYLLETYPAREVEFSAYAIAKRPITVAEYRQFMADTGETQEPHYLSRARGPVDDNSPARGISWWVAKEIANWAGARLPFADEWERAVRGVERRLFSWGNQFSPIGDRVIREGFINSLPSSLTESPEGFGGALSYSEEWCAELAGDGWSRLSAGASHETSVVPSAVSREPEEGRSYAHSSETALVRLVRADGKALAPPAVSTPSSALAVGPVRAFEFKVVQPLLHDLHRARIGHMNRIFTHPMGFFPERIRGASDLSVTVNARHHFGYRIEKEFCHGAAFIAESLESLRRVNPLHGLFFWTIQYRLDDRGEIRARPVTAFHMAFDNGIHRFENRFRPSEPDTRLAELTPEMIRASIYDAFQFYELHADSDENPFRSK